MNQVGLGFTRCKFNNLVNVVSIHNTYTASYPKKTGFHSVTNGGIVSI